MEYKIKTIEDFLKVPPDRLEVCLQEFKTWCEMTRPLEDAIKAVADCLYEKIELGFERGFTWIDDGERNVTINFMTPTPKHDGGE
jgi:hypothetical protein